MHREEGVQPWHAGGRCELRTWNKVRTPEKKKSAVYNHPDPGYFSYFDHSTQYMSLLSPKNIKVSSYLWAFACNSIFPSTHVTKALTSVKSLLKFYLPSEVDSLTILFKIVITNPLSPATLYPQNPCYFLQYISPFNILSCLCSLLFTVCLPPTECEHL